MILKEYFLAQLDREAASTRKTIERVPEGHNSFKPHGRSMEFGYLSALVAGMLGWIASIIDRDELDLEAPESASFRTKPLSSRAELLASLDRAVADARRALQSTTDEHLAKPWAFKMRGTPLSQNPRSIMIADAVSAISPIIAANSRSICAWLIRKFRQFTAPLRTSTSDRNDLRRLREHVSARPRGTQVVCNFFCSRQSNHGLALGP